MCSRYLIDDKLMLINSSPPCDAIPAPSHYVNHYWLKIICINPGAISQKIGKLCWLKLWYEIKFLGLCKGKMS